MSKRAVLKRNDSIVFREEDDVGLLFDPDTGKVDVLNDTGRFIWQQLDGRKNRDEIAQDLMQNFHITDPKVAVKDVEAFLTALHRKGFIEGHREALPLPGSVCFGITSKCNLSCKHCLNRNAKGSDPDMTTDELLGLIDQMADGGVGRVNLFGGEPICHPDFKRIVEYLIERKLKASLNTNATLIDREMACWLSAHGIKSTCVSLDGSCPSVMDRIRGQGAFEKTLKGIEALRSENIQVLLSVTLNKLNHQDIREMILLGKKIDGGSIRFNHVFFGGNADCFSKELYLFPQEEKNAIEVVYQAKTEFGEFINPSSSYLCQRDKLGRVDSFKPSKDKITVSPCGAGIDKCAIRPDGWITPCEVIWDVKCGNLREASMADIWQNSEVLNSFRRPLVLDLDEIPECKDCRYQYMCFIGHRCYPYHYPGGVKNKDLYCWLRKEA
ncbi:MAG: radical SAM protein [Candidatus Omnitrophica bacterium]|nr:radical SAM protein [Candidatus Omnitrophota bacterium]